MYINKAIEDFRSWYDNNKIFQSLKLYNFMADDNGILYDGCDISPELKDYYIEFGASDPKDLFNNMCTFGNPCWQIECRICKLHEVQLYEDYDIDYDVIGMHCDFNVKDAFEGALSELEGYIRRRIVKE